MKLIPTTRAIPSNRARPSGLVEARAGRRLPLPLLVLSPSLLFPFLLGLATGPLWSCSPTATREERDPADLALLAGDAAWAAEDLEAAEVQYWKAASLSLGSALVVGTETAVTTPPHPQDGDGVDAGSNRPPDSPGTNAEDSPSDRCDEILTVSVTKGTLDDDELATGAMALNQLGLIAERRGKLRDAENLYRGALNLQPSIADAQDRLIPHLNLASVLFSQDRVEEAEGHARQALELADTEEEWLGAGHAHRVVGQICVATGRTEEGLSHLSQASRLLEGAGAPWPAAATRRELAQLFLETGHPRDAVREFSSSRQTYRRFKDVEGELRALRGLARSYAALGQPENALTFWERLLQLREDEDEPEGLREEARAEALELSDRLAPGERERWSRRLLDARPAIDEDDAAD